MKGSGTAAQFLGAFVCFPSAFVSQGRRRLRITSGRPLKSPACVCVLRNCSFFIYVKGEEGLLWVEKKRFLFFLIPFYLLSTKYPRTKFNEGQTGRKKIMSERTRRFTTGNVTRDIKLSSSSPHPLPPPHPFPLVSTRLL